MKKKNAFSSVYHSRKKISSSESGNGFWDDGVWMDEKEQALKLINAEAKVKILSESKAKLCYIFFSYQLRMALFPKSPQGCPNSWVNACY